MTSVGTILLKKKQAIGTVASYLMKQVLVKWTLD